MSVITIDHLYTIADQLGGIVVYRDLHARHPQLDAYTRPPVIVIDKSLLRQPRHHRCVLAEEVGHLLYPPRPGHVSYHIAQSWDNLDSPSRENLSVLVAQDERKALQWATRMLIPDPVFWEYVDTGPHEIWEWLEEFEVEKWFFEVKVGLVRAQQPIRLRLRWREILKRDGYKPLSKGGFSI